MSNKPDSCRLSLWEHLHGTGTLYCTADGKTCVSVTHVYTRYNGDVRVQYRDAFDYLQDDECDSDAFKQQFPRSVERIEVTTE
ncbi:hypothetical protein LCGC14_1004210 [marine sediment metagenome]|uniref:Uncharacterized protein n=1 Tax=marine sediment metagenome TaxID=412755 RepID=A0A0F9N6S3_9ZZZZ